ncbi:hypothetical protein GCM10011390_32580 [Aureimonas endophytica]|uniref:Transglutaminase-like domain-containing protein n=1 Tax=Aureimonas endophytica TaxID=2027858 RepID=A0A916ZRV1_9HYPH|nr:transglutaminase-like domain-containing protein [Aureimonas endophytica]GGE11010.1 hypothetical protein GCM10011390_32580 [Aureimonas endophytica]
MPTIPLPTRLAFGDRYRCVGAPRILDMLLLGGFAEGRERPEARRACEAALAAAFDLGLRHRAAPDGGRLLDPVEVLHVLKAAALSGRHGFWRERFVATGRRMVEDLARRDPASDFELSTERRFALGAVAPGARLRLRLPLPLPGAHEALAVEPFPAPPGASLAVTPGRLEARLVAGGEAAAELGARLRFRPGPPPDDAPGEAHLRPREGLIVVTDRVAALARRLAGTQGAEAAVRAFWDFLMERFACLPLHYDQIDPAAPCDFALETGGYDCQLGAALLVALCRARAIPARLVGGHVLYRAAPTNHFWAEIHLGEAGWGAFDLLGWDLSAGGADAAWRDRFFGAVDARMITERRPFDFTGAAGVPIPPIWHLLQVPSGDGVLLDLLDAAGETLHADRLELLP